MGRNMSNNIKFNKSLIATLVATSLLTACGGDDKTTVEPAAVQAPVDATTVIEEGAVIIEDVAETSSVSGSVSNGANGAALAGLTVNLHIDGERMTAISDDNGVFYFDELVMDADFLVEVVDENGMYANSYYAQRTDASAKM